MFDEKKMKEKMMGMGPSMEAQKDVLMAIKKLASEAMMQGMDDDEAVVAELDMKKMPKEEAMEMAEEAMEGEMPEDMMESEDEEDEDSMEEKLLKKKLGL